MTECSPLKPVSKVLLYYSLGMSGIAVGVGNNDPRGSVNVEKGGSAPYRAYRYECKGIGKRGGTRRAETGQ